jgi:CRP-like cAMP-binding protein
LVGVGSVSGILARTGPSPRTATVTASSDASLYTLGREEFLTAITGMADVHGAARTMASERLAQQTAEQAGD